MPYNPIREAIVISDVPLETVRHYLPNNYKAYPFGVAILITGADDAGWTMDGYVIPRLQSGNIIARETRQ